MLASERQACDRQKLLEYPELVRQRDQLDKEIKMMKLTSVEREDHAYQEGYDEGFRVLAPRLYMHAIASRNACCLW